MRKGLDVWATLNASMMRRADDVKLQERLDCTELKPGRRGYGCLDILRVHASSVLAAGLAAGFSNQRLEPSSFFSGLCTNHSLTILTITTTPGPSNTLHVYLTIFSQGVFESAIVDFHNTQGTTPQRPAFNLIASHRIASIRHHKTGRRQTELIGSVELLKS